MKRGGQCKGGFDPAKKTCEIIRPFIKNYQTNSCALLMGVERKLGERSQSCF